MTTILSRALVLAALLTAAPLMARDGAAQRTDRRVQASAFVTGSVQVFGLRADTARVQPARHARRLVIAGVGALEVQAEPGAVTRIVPYDARLVRITIDFVAN